MDSFILHLDTSLSRAILVGQVFPKKCPNMLDVKQLRCALIIFDISSSERAFQRPLFVKDIPTHFASLPDPWTPADPLPPTCGRPWRVEVEAMLTLRRPLVPSGFPRYHAWTLQTPLAPMLGTQALVVVRVPSSHSDATNYHCCCC